MDEDSLPDSRRMRLRYDGTCRVCGVALEAKTEAIYEPASKTVRCFVHDQPTVAPAEVEAFDAGTPGASARREFERRKASRDQRIRTRHPKLGGLILALSEDPQSTKAWDTGALGEERLGSRLNEFASDLMRVLHDRRIPAGRANIDHLAVVPTGVYVIDAKKYKGRPQLTVEGGLLRPRVEKLIVGDDLPVHGILCFVEADWPLIGGSFTTRGVEALWPKKLYSKLKADGPLESQKLAEIHRTLASSLPPA